MALPTGDAPVAERAEDARVGVVIATRDRSDLLRGTLSRLLALPEAPAVLVVDDASRDGTAAMVGARFPAVALTTLEHSRGAAARNVGVERSTAPYVALTDDDAHWAPGELARAAAVLDEHPRVALVAPRILVGSEESGRGNRRPRGMRCGGRSPRRPGSRAPAHPGGPRHRSRPPASADGRRPLRR